MTTYTQYRPNRPIHLKNNNCPYCGRMFDSSTVTNEEHAIGRNFVPKTSTENQLNLIFRACKICNDEKAQLEDDISVISMIPRHAGRGPETEAILAHEVARKAKGAGSRRTGRSVAKSDEHVTLHGNIGNATLSVGFTGPPQIDPQRVYRLAQLHFDAFFFEATYDAKSNIGGFFPHKHHHNVGYFPISNWGAEKAKWFMTTTHTWPTIWAVVTAKGFFKLIIRHSPCQTMWACAVEWNQSMRVMRLLGKDADTLRSLVNLSPQPAASWHADEVGNPMKVILERSLAPEEDNLFRVIADEL